MACNFHNLVQALYDGELVGAEAVRAAEHVRGCRDCEKLLDGLRAVSMRVTGAELRDPSRMTLERLKQTLRRRQERSVRRLTGWLTAAAAAVVGGVLLLTPTGSPGVARGADGPVVNVAMFGAGTSEEVPDVVLAAHWMATDLSVSGRDER